MHILYIHQHFSTPFGATGTRSYEMSRCLLERGHEVTMVCGRGQMARSGVAGEFRSGMREGIVDGINVIELYLPYSNYDSFLKRTWTFLRYAWRCSKLALTLDYDLLFATSTPLTAGIPGIIMKLFRKKPFIFEVRDLWPELPREMGVITNPLILKAMDVLEFLSYWCSDSCVGLAPGIVDGILRRNVKPSNVAMIPNGCDLELFKPCDSKGNLQIVGVEKTDFTAVFCGAHGIANGLEAVLKTAKVLKERGVTNIKFLFIGDGKLKPCLIELARQEGLDNCIFGNPLEKHELAQIIGRCDVGLMILANVPAFYYGTSPNKFFDYLASGLPVITNYPGWIADMIGRQNCGVAVAPEDPIAFANALVFLYEKLEERIEMGRNARALAEKSFGRDMLADQLTSFLEQFAGDGMKKERCQN